MPSLKALPLACKGLVTRQKALTDNNFIIYINQNLSIPLSY